jgi:hypothetical protein
LDKTILKNHLRVVFVFTPKSEYTFVMTQKDILITVIGIFILLAIGGLVLYPKKAAGPKLPSIDKATLNGPGFPPPSPNHK